MAKSEQLTVLSYAVRIRVLLKYLGQMGLALAALTAVPLAVALYFGDYALAIRYAIVLGLLIAAAFPASRLAAPSPIQTNEALAAIALLFILAALLMTYPLMSAGLGFLDAFFEAVSGVTTTGLSSISSIEDKPATFLFARAWMQWYGGLGIVVLSIGLLAGHNMASRRLLEPDVSTENIVSTTRTHARRVLLVYIVLTCAGVLALSFLPIDTLTAVTHTLSAVSTGGFSTHNHSLADFNGTAVAWVVSGISICGAISLPLYYWTYVRGWHQLKSDPELPTLLAAIFVIGIGLFMALRSAMPLQSAISNAVLLGISAQTTTGYSTVAVPDLNATAKVLLLFSMAAGGCVGSTAGGVKLLRVLIAMRLFSLLIRRTGAPAHAVLQARLGGKPLEQNDIARALSLILLFAFVILASWVCFVAFGHDPLDSLFEVVSATGTVGLSTGITRPELSPVLKTVLCFDMLAGRLEIVALLVLLYPGTWLGKKVELV